MINAVVDAMIDRANGRRVAIAWVAFVLFAAVAFPLFDVVNGMPEEIKPLDIQFFYRPSRVFEVLESLGGDGRSAYLRSLLIADVAWPLIYGATLALSTVWGFAGSALQRRLVWLPVATVAADFAENLLIVSHILRFPQQQSGLAALVSGVSAVKWVLAGTATVVALAALARGLRGRQSARRAGVSSS